MADLSYALIGMAEDMRSVVLVKGVKEAVKPILVAAKRFSKRSERTGALRASLTTKVIGYKNSGKAVGLVGPDRNYYSKGKAVKGLGALFAAKRIRPANYAHLVEYGHVIAKGGKVRPVYNIKLIKTGGFSAKGKPLKRWKRFGIKEQAKGTVGGWVPPKPFIRPAVATTMTQQAAAFFSGISGEYSKSARRNSSPKYKANSRIMQAGLTW